MKVIGITGGVGAGKSTVLDIIRQNCRCFILIADEAAHEVERRGQVCYDELVGLLGREILASDGEIDKKKMARKIFAAGNKELLASVNAIVHPRVKEYILDLIEKYKADGKVDYFFIEAALLIEDGYRAICDELWYAYAPKEVRAGRLKASRGYTDSKIEDIMRSQNDDETFRKYCDHVIENSGDLEETGEQIKKLLGQKTG